MIDPVTTVLVAGPAILVGLLRLASGGEEPKRQPARRQVDPSGWVDPDAPRRIRIIASRVEEVTGMRGLGDYLAGIAWIESRGNPKAGPDSLDNAARGWFGIRPNSARLTERGLPVSALKDEATAVALAADYAHRLQPYAAPGQVMDWEAVRRGWGFPHHVDDIGHPRYPDKLARGLAKAGVPRSFMKQPAFPPGYRWPGFQAVLEAAR